ncbi:MFS transporter [Pseudoalteromonas sp. T1lg65]|uniref:MFS transporter n=1 Tax=Pseudoalteromonas sp. T1lg65 TaxID=2077101 RepID=UPI003F799C20
MQSDQQVTADKLPMDNAEPSSSGFGRAFYIANFMEIFERLAWYGFFAVSSIYMTTPKSQGGVGFNDIERGAVQGIIPFFLYLLPVFTGALGDRIGYKRMFILAFAIMTPSYYLLGQVQSFWPFFIVLSVVAFGAACFKPVVVGTVTHSTNDKNRGLGFGIFYTMVNVGGFIGPLVAGYMRAISWDAVFMMSAAWIAINFIPVLLFYKDPPSLPKSKLPLSQIFKDAQSVLGNSRFAITMFTALIILMTAGVGLIDYQHAFLLIGCWLILNYLWDKYCTYRQNNAQTWWRQPTKVSNVPFALYLLILAGFWTVYNQLFYTLPLYIRDYSDTRDLLVFLSWFGDGAVNFFAHVDVTKLSHAVSELYNRLTPAAQVDIEAIRLEWVHLKVNVPSEVISEMVDQLNQLKVQEVVLSEQQLQNVVTTLVEYRQVNPEYLINLDFAAIVLLQILVSALCQRFKPFYVLVWGMVVITLAFTLLVAETSWISGQLVVLVILLIALGEMLASPKSQEYVASIAPKSQAALYMGYYFVSMALGFLFAGFLSGWSYKVLVQEMAKPELMWGLFAIIAVVTGGGLFWFNRVMVRR